MVNNQVLYKIIKNIRNHDIYLGNYIINDKQYYYLDGYKDLVYTLLTTGFLHQSIFYKRYLFIKNGLYNEKYKIITDWLFN